MAIAISVVAVMPYDVWQVSGDRMGSPYFDSKVENHRQMMGFKWTVPGQTVELLVPMVPVDHLDVISQVMVA